MGKIEQSGWQILHGEPNKNGADRICWLLNFRVLAQDFPKARRTTVTLPFSQLYHSYI